MATLTLELPPQKTQTAFNLRRWAELLADRELAKVEGRIETDRHGHVIMSPPPAPSHGSYQLEIGYLLRKLLPDGRTLTECPISTADGVKAADVAWAYRLGAPAPVLGHLGPGGARIGVAGLLRPLLALDGAFLKIVWHGTPLDCVNPDAILSATAG